MTTQYTSILKLALPVTGELSGTWGDVVNDNITSMVEEAIAGLATINSWSSNSHTLTTANGTSAEARCSMLVLTDTGTALTGAATVVCPTASKIYIVKNDCGQTATIKTSGGTGVAIPDGDTMFVFCDGTNVVQAVTRLIDADVSFTTLKGTGAVIVTNILDEDDMASDSATALATQQSIKAYVDAQISANNDLSEVLANGNTTGGTDLAVSAGDDITFTDTSKAIFGTDGDLEVYHDGSNAYATNTTGSVIVGASGLTVQNAAGTETLLTAAENGAVTAYYDNASKLATATDGVDITGALRATGTARIGAENTDTSLTTFGTGNLTLSTNEGTNSGTIVIAQGVDGNITLDPNGTGKVAIDAAYVTGGTIDGTTIGGTTPAAGSFTTLSASSSVTLSGGTANGVAYLNGSKVLTTGSALTFDGTNFAVGSASAIGGGVVSAQGDLASVNGYVFKNSAANYGNTNNFVRLINSSSATVGGLTHPAAASLGVWGNDDIRFLTTGAASEKMRLTSTGLGIGTSSPTNKLSVTGNANITGNTTLGDASTDTVTVNGYMGVGVAPNAANALWVRSNELTGTGQAGTRSEITGTSAATSYVAGAVFSASTAAASFTTTNAFQLFVNNSTKGAGSTITNQHGVYIADQTQGTNNYGITSLVSSGTNKWNIYASGTAANYFAGNVGIGTSSPADKLTVVGDIRFGSSTSYLKHINDTAGWTLGMPSGSNVYTISSGIASPVERLRLSTTEAVFNDPGNDYDFRVESDTNTHALFVEGSSGNVGIGTSSPLRRFHSNDSANAIVGRFSSGQSSSWLQFASGSTGTASRIGSPTNDSTASLAFMTADVERLRIDSSGNLGLGVTPSAWGAMLGIELGSYGSALATWKTNRNTYILSNAYFDAVGFKYKTTGSAVYYNASGEDGAHKWLTAPSGTAGNAISFTQAMTLNANGNYSLGTTSPTEIAGYITQSINGTSGSLTEYRQNNSNTFRVGSDSSSGGFLFTQAANPIRFGTDDTERARIDSSGNLLVGTTNQLQAASSRLNVAGDFYNANGVSLKTTNGGSGAQFIGFINESGSLIGSISRVTTTNAVVYNTTSDVRLKSNIEDSSPVLEKLMQVQVRQYDWTEGNLHQDYGFIAQEIEPILSGVVSKGRTEEDVWQLDYSKLTPHLLKAIQEQQAIINDLKARLDAANL